MTDGERHLLPNLFHHTCEVLGVFCALNLFLAILLAPFDVSDLILSSQIYPEGETASTKEDLAFFGISTLHTKGTYHFSLAEVSKYPDVL